MREGVFELFHGLDVLGAAWPSIARTLQLEPGIYLADIFRSECTTQSCTLKKNAVSYYLTRHQPSGLNIKGRF